VAIFVRRQNVAQTAFAEYHDMINAFPADRTDQPFNAPAETHDQQSLEQPERDCRHDEEDHGNNAIRMIVKQRLPSLRGGPLPPCHILGDAGLADLCDSAQQEFKYFGTEIGVPRRIGAGAPACNGRTGRCEGQHAVEFARCCPFERGPSDPSERM
jgi:hypothetical protein